jgi:hypothetical protein
MLNWEKWLGIPTEEELNRLRPPAQRPTLNGDFPMRSLIAAALLLALTSTGQARDIFGHQVFMKNDQGQIVDTGFKPPDFATDCDAKDGTPRWGRLTSSKPLFSCSMETEGDGNAGSAGMTTFTYHFVEVGSGRLRLDRVTTSRGATLPAYSIVQHIRRR